MDNLKMKFKLHGLEFELEGKEATVKEEFDSGKKFVLNNVYFEQGSFILSPSSNTDLDNLAQLMKENPKARLIIAGHTDNVGDARLNEYLSENRAKVIANYLTDKGILSTRLIPRGFGGSKPLAPNDNEENRKKNRRVEFMVL